ncbi:WD repeat-containing protein on Y chromosome-like [Styela clava]
MSENGHDGSGGKHSLPSDEKWTKRKLQNAATKATAFSGPARLDDDMKYDDLRNLETIFNDSSGETGLDMEQFRVAMKKTMGYHINDTELDMIFMKVDTNCDGTVDWDEYLSYMLLEYQEKENMVMFNSDLPFPQPMRSKSSNHLESICRIELLQSYTIRNNGKVELEDSSSRYITLSKEGVLNLWNLEWNLQKSTLLDGMRHNPRAVWFTDLVCMPNCNTIAVASTDYEISFYSMTTNMFQKKFQIKDMDCCALALSYHFDYSNVRRSILLWGDSSGSVYVLRFYDNPSLALFSSTSPSCLDNKISLSSLVKGHIHNLRVGRFLNVHPDWISELHYYVNAKRQEFLVTCCRSQRNSMVFAEITEKLTGNALKKVEMHRKSYFSVHNGVSCVAYDPEWNVIVSGSSDFNVRVWNPYVTNSSTMILKGHVMPVQKVYIRMSDHNIISVSKDKNIRIWDSQDYACKQSIHGHRVNLGRLDVTALLYNERRMELILGTNAIGVFTASSSSSNTIKKRGDPTSHTKPITKVLYNALFKQLVTGSEDSMVSIWDLKTGTKTMQFCTDFGVEITAMAFDPTKRRLITGSRNGSISLWNFNNGARLRTLRASDTLEVSSVLHAKNRIISSGWNKNVTVHHDSYTDESFRRMRMKHKDDVLSMDYHRQENILGTSSYDGEIYIWSLDVECVLLKFNMHVSILPIQEIKHGIGSNAKLTLPGRVSSSTQNAAQNNFVHLPVHLPWVVAAKQERREDKTELRNSEDSKDYGSLRKYPSDKAVNKIIFLQTRRSTNNVAVLFAATTCYVVAWSVHQRGGILGYFNAVKHSGEMILEMETDEENKILVTGDSRGYIRVWKIDNYCNGQDVVERRKRMKVGGFTNLFEGVDSKQAEAYREQHSYVPADFLPKLQTSFRGHCKAIMSIAFITDANLIASGAADCCVRLWTLSGRYIGTFGQKNNWHLEFPIKDSKLPVAMPNDVRRIASPTTLYTVKGGYHVQWKQVRHAVGFVGKTAGIFNKLKSKNEPPPEEDEIKRRFSSLSEDLVKAAKPGKRLSRQERRDSITFWMEDRPFSITNTFKKIDEVGCMYDRIEKEGITSKVLGRINYKPKQRHKQSDINANIKWIDKSAIVYSTLPCSELDEPIQVTIPDYFQKKIGMSKEVGALSRVANKLIERRRVIHTFTGKTPSTGTLSKPPKHSALDLEDQHENEDTASNSRASSGSSQKTKRVNFSEDF